VKPATPSQRESKDSLLSDTLKKIVKEAVREELKEALSSQASKPPKLLINAAEASDMLSIPKTWIETQAREGGIPSVRCGHYRLFRIEDLKQFIEKSKTIGESHDENDK
jgi:excisionase family DNA binding protein